MVRSTDTWTWNVSLSLRPIAQQFLKCRVGNGDSASFWYDCWTPFGRLLDHIGSTGPCNLRIPLTATVSEASDGVNWTLPQPRSDSALALHIHLTTVMPPHASAEPDSNMWIVNGTDCYGFSSGKTWDMLRPRSIFRQWAQTIWFKGHIPKHAFTMWVANLNRLPTKDRLIRWGLNIQPSCCLCTTAAESRNHLLITCGYAEFVWHHILQKLNRSHLFYSWTELMSWIRKPSSATPSTLKMVAAQATVYHLWKQRNNSLHNGVCLPPHTFVRLIDREVRNVITGRRGRKRFEGLMVRWLS